MTTALESISAAPAAVENSALLAALEQLKQAPLDAKVGLYGPGSLFWEVNRHTLPYFLGAVQSVQMQLCHPWVAVAVFEHSKIMSDPRARQRLTYIFLWSLIYGDLDTVARKANGLFKVHARVQGTVGAEAAGRHTAGSEYRANEVNAMLWVHVTAFWSRVKQYEALVKPLTPGERDRFCQEAKLYARCFGIPDETHPQSWQEVEDYIAAMAESDTLAYTDAGMTIRRFLENSIPKPLRNALWTYMCVPLPERIQTLLDQPLATEENLARAERTRRRLKRVENLLPAKLRYVPAWHEAMARIAGKPSAGWLVEKMSVAMLGVPRLVI